MISITNKQRLYFAIMVNIIIPLAGISTDIYLPSLPAISNYFHVTKDLSQFTVTAYIVAMGLSQLIAGPISDAYGRKKLLFLAIFIQLFAVVGILISTSICWMIISRFIQGFGAALMIVPARAIINDIFTGTQLRKQFNYSTITFALGPIIAPFLGGYLQQYFGWQANFYFTLIYIFLAIALLFFYQETIAAPRAFSINHLWKNYQIILRDRYFVILSIFVGIIWGYTAFFNIAGPFLVQTVLHKSATEYGHLALLMGVAWFIGNSLNRLFFDANKNLKMLITLWGTFISAIGMLVVVQLGYLNIATLAIPTFIIIAFSGCIFPIYVAEGMTFFPSMTASVNACLFALMWLVFGFFTIAAAVIKIKNLVPLSLSYLCVSIICIIIYYGFITKLENLRNEDNL